jgi:hypothetical protein
MYPRTKEAKETERNIIQDIFHSNAYIKNLSTRHSDQQKHNKNTDRQHQKTKWAIFTYSGKERKKIAKLFKEMQIGIAFRQKNIMPNMVKPH